MNNFKFTDEQQKIVDYILEQVELKEQGNNVIISGVAGSGKAMAVTIKIPTPSGYKRFGDLKVGDMVFDFDGRPTKVIGIYPQGIKRNYKITLADGRVVHSCADHLWSVWTSRGFKSGSLCTKSLKKIMSDYEQLDNRGHKIHQYYLPTMSHPVNYETKDLPIDPYVFGCFLNSNCKDNYLVISMKGQEQIREILKEKTEGIFHDDKISITFFKKFENYISCRKEEKTIPEIYLTGDVSQRTELLQGLLDIRGSARTDRNGIVYSHMSIRLVEQVQQLVWSLGGHCSPIRKCGQRYQVHLTALKATLMNWFKAFWQKKIIAKSPICKTHFEKSAIVNIEEDGESEMMCIMVDNPLHLYLTENFVATHNTTLVCQLICILLQKGYRIAAGTMTGKATGVLRKKILENIEQNQILVEKDQLLIDTITKMTKQAKVLGTTAFGTTLFSNTWYNPALFNYDILILDELSMVPSYLYAWWSRTKCRVIGLGDFCQIPEVIGNDTIKETTSLGHDLHIQTPTLIPQYGVRVLKDLATFQLHTVLRSIGDITLLCNDLRNFAMTSKQIKSTLKKWAKKSSCISYSTSLEDLETGKDWQIIAYTNKLCQEINDKLSIGTDYPDLQDKVLLFDNLNPINCYNGEVYLFQDLIEKVNQRNKEDKGQPLMVVWKFNNQMPRKDSPYDVERMSYANWIRYSREAKLKNRQKLDSIKATINALSFLNDHQKEVYLQDVQHYRETILDPEQCFTTIVQNFENADPDIARQIVLKAPPSPSVFFINIGFGYCCTTHKSQGSEYDKVCYILERMDKPLLYTGCSRAKKELKVIDLI